MGNGRKGRIPGKRTEARERGIFRKPEGGWGVIQVTGGRKWQRSGEWGED